MESYTEVVRSEEVKYGNKKTVVNGITFDSKKEAQRYSELCFLQRAGEISGLQLQVPFELIPAQYETVERYNKNGKRLKDGKKCVEKGVSYVADFLYYQNGKRIVEDTKGAKTKEYIIKRKLLLYIHGIKIKEV